MPVSLSVAQLSWVNRIHIEWEVTMYWAMIGLANALAYRAEAQDRAVEAAGLEGRLAHAQLQALQSQLQPHFLFNTLHAISAMVRRDADGAEVMIERLADLLRMTLKMGATSETTLRQELTYVDHYLAIEQVHMGERLVVVRDVDPDALDALVPPLLLQPLVENAIRHGLSGRATGGCLEIRVRRAGESLELGSPTTESACRSALAGRDWGSRTHAGGSSTGGAHQRFEWVLAQGRSVARIACRRTAGAQVARSA